MTSVQCASPAALGPPYWVSIVPPVLGGALWAAWGSGGHCTEAAGSFILWKSSGYDERFCTEHFSL